jgi:hypothetical protein
MGTEAFWIPAVMAMASAGGQALNQSAANKRGQNAEVEAMANQNLLKNAANSDVKQQIKNVATSDPAKLAAAENSQFVNTLRNDVGGSTGTTSKSPTNFGAPTSALGPTPGGSSRYSADTAKAGTEVQSFGNTTASEMSALDSAINMRKNEGLQMQTLSGNLNQLNQQAYQQAFVDQLRYKAASQPNPWVSMFTGGLDLASNGMSKNGWFTPGNPGGDNSAALGSSIVEQS